MQPEVALAILEQLQRTHPEPVHALDDRGYAYIESMIRLLPEGCIWTIAKPAAAVYARCDEALFLLTLPADGRRASLTSRPADPSRAPVIRFEWLEPPPLGSARLTRWTFRFPGHDPEFDVFEEITGEVIMSSDVDAIDDAETLAREIAADAGWTFDAKPVEQLSR